MGSFLSLAKLGLARWFGNHRGSKPLQKRKKPGSTLRPQLLCLEERVTPATYTVDSPFDFGNPGDLRNAITQANATRENDTINLSFNFVTNISLLSALPSIMSASSAGTLTITGPGAEVLNITCNTANASRNYRALIVDTGANLTVSGVTISEFRRESDGAAIYNSGTLTLNNCIVSNNSAIEANGGAIYSSGKLTLNNSTVTNNTTTMKNNIIDITITTGLGGGIYNEKGTLTLNNSTITSNITGWECGGIYNDKGTLTVSNSNIADNFGDGIYNSGTLTVSNSTFTNNSGEGIYNNGTLNVSNSTISSNTVGGIYSTGDTSVINCTIASNTGGPGLIRNNTVFIPPPLILQNTILYNNSAGDYDGAQPASDFYGRSECCRGGSRQRWHYRSGHRCCRGWGP